MDNHFLYDKGIQNNMTTIMFIAPTYRELTPSEIKWYSLVWKLKVNTAKRNRFIKIVCMILFIAICSFIIKLIGPNNIQISLLIGFTFGIIYIFVYNFILDKFESDPYNISVKHKNKIYY